MTDQFENYSSALDSPPANLATVTPNDGADLAVTSRCINVAQAGNVRVVTVGGQTVTIYIAAGIFFPVRARRILATGTDATDIVVGW